MKNKACFLVAIFMLTSITACNKNLVVKDMISFDKAFIPVFYYSSIGNLKKAQTAMYPLNAKWQQFNIAYSNKHPESDDWNESIRLVGAWLSETDCALQDGDMTLAKYQLDHARYELMDLRYREGINDYYLDFVWDFESSMNVVIQVATDPMVELLDWNEFEPICREVTLAWLSVMDQEVNEGLCSADSGTHRTLHVQKDKLDYAVRNLEQALATGGRCEVAEAALAVEPAYLNFLAMFGDFESVQSYYALKE